MECETVQCRLFLLHLDEGVPVVKEEILKRVIGVVSLCAACSPKAEQIEGLAAGPNAALNYVRVTQCKVARVEGLSRPARANNVRYAVVEFAVLDQDVLNVVAGTDDFFVGIAVPVALHGEHVVRGTQECVTNKRIAAAEPIHSVLIGISRVAADDAQIIECESRGVLHLD